MAPYNGFKSWNEWNVVLWINNDEPLYYGMLDMIRHCTTKDIAARQFYDTLKSAGVTHTPDGAPYTITSIRKAMTGHGR